MNWKPEMPYGITTGANGKKFYYSDSSNPPMILPFCCLHNKWPCRYCGTSHSDDCECGVCDDRGLAQLAPRPLGTSGERRD